MFFMVAIDKCITKIVISLKYVYILWLLRRFMIKSNLNAELNSENILFHTLNVVHVHKLISLFELVQAAQQTKMHLF